MNALQNIEQTWQDWVSVNLKRKVPVNTLASTLVEHGMPEAALELLRQHNLSISCPEIDLSKNQVSLPDKDVSVLFASSSPMVVVIDNFLHNKECKQLIKHADTELLDSKVVNPDDGKSVQHQGRTSSSTSYQRGETPLVKKIEDRISALLNWPVKNGEGLQILKYKKGGEYRPHFDFFDPKLESSANIVKKGGQRVGTFLMYLSDVEAGGGTAFPNVGFEIRPKAGMALYFANTKMTGQIDEQTLHAGLPVTSGVKYLATKWLRQEAYE